MSEKRQRTEKINICLTQVQHTMIKSMAEAMDVSASEVCRSAIERAISKSVVNPLAVNTLVKRREELDAAGMQFKKWLTEKSDLKVANLLSDISSSQKNIARAILEIGGKNV